MFEKVLPAIRFPSPDVCRKKNHPARGAMFYEKL